MSRSSGTGFPLWFKCARCRKSAPLSRRPTDVVRTGLTRPRPSGMMIRSLREHHQYRCKTCRHVGWTSHSGILHFPLESSEKTAETGG